MWRGGEAPLTPEARGAGGKSGERRAMGRLGGGGVVLESSQWDLFNG